MPIEFGYYSSYPKTYKFIETLDTSNPVINGMHNIKYDNLGVKDKLDVRMVDVFNIKNIKPAGKKLIKHNIEKFKNIVNNPNSIN